MYMYRTRYQYNRLRALIARSRNNAGESARGIRMIFKHFEVNRHVEKETGATSEEVQTNKVECTRTADVTRVTVSLRYCE